MIERSRMEYQKDYCYMSLVDTLRDKYRRRSREVSRLLEERDLEGIARRAERIRKALEEQLSSPLLESCPLEPEVVDILRYPAYRVEKITLQALPGVAVPVNFYLPAAAGKYPAAVVTMGHWFHAKAMESNQILCANLAMQGIAAITFDPICQGERNPYSEAELAEMFGPDSEDMWMVGLHTFAGNLAYFLGENLGALFVHEARCVVDYLCARPEIDAERIGAVGQSGGGTQACYLAALDPRVKIYMPIQCLSRLAVTLDGGIGDCEQSFAGISAQEGVEQSDLLWAALPKPVMQSAGRFDFFSVEGVYDIQSEMTGLYRVLGRQGDYQLAMADCGHELSQETRGHVYQWFSMRFLGRPAEPEQPVDVLPPRALRCLKPGKAVWPTEVYRRHMLAEKPRRAAAPEALRNGLKKLLGPPDGRCRVEPISRCGEERSVRIHTARDHSAFCRLEKRASDTLCVVVAPGSFRLEAPDASVLYVTPWAMETAYGKAAMGYDLETCMFNTALVLGKNLLCERVRQLAAAVNWACGQAGAVKVRFVGVGAGSVPALLAACLETRLERTVLAQCQVSMEDLFSQMRFYLCETNLLPGMLRVGDLPDFCRLARAVVLDPLHWDGTGYTPEEAAAERRVRCACGDLQVRLQRYFQSGEI